MLISRARIASLLPAGLHRRIKTIGANRRDRAIIRRLRSLHAVTAWERPPCAICGQTESIPHFRRNGFTVVRCPNDGLLFVSPRPTDLSAYYSAAYYEGGDTGTYADYSQHAISMIPAWSDRISRIETELGHPGHLLDVGAATGQFMALARNRGWRTTGVEMSSWAVKRGIEEGLEIKLGSLPHPDLAPETFDAITMWDAIEHFSDPRGVLAAARKLVRTPSIIAISTGAVPHRDVRAESAWYNPPWHLYYFSPETIEALLREVGFSVRRIDIESPATPYALMTVWAQPVPD